MKKILAVLILCASIAQAGAQEIYNSSGRAGKPNFRDNAEKKGFDPNKLIFGGGLGFGMGSGTLAFSISPIIGYRISDKFAAGVSLGYQYYKANDMIAVLNYQTAFYDYYDYKSTTISAGAWARYLIWDNIFLHAEYEHNFLSYRDYESDFNGVRSKNVRYNVPCLLLGGGYRQPVGEHLSFVIMALYDVLQNIPRNTVTDAAGNKYSLSPYANRLDIRIGVNIGF